jgi:glutamine synthetase
MVKYKFEYIWLDGYKPEPNLRSKTKIIDCDATISLDELPIWSFDGSSTKQASGDKSDLLLKPVRMITDPQRKNGFLVLCEVLNPDGTPHQSNTRSLCIEDSDFWFGFEQEYTLIDPNTNRPLGFPNGGYPEEQGKYYCGVGYGNVTGRDIIEKHLDVCLAAGLEITGINFEVMLGQAEYQLLSKGSKRGGDELWLSRYLLYRITEEVGLKISFHPKPVINNGFNGSGCHVNFSNKEMREVGGRELMISICESLKECHDEAISIYGSDNNLRLTGKYETQSIDKFTYGVSDRGASIRIPISVANENWKGYLEDRRPSSNCDPYKVVNLIVSAVLSSMVETII